MRIFIMKKNTLIKAAVFILLVVGAVLYTQFFVQDTDDVFNSKTKVLMPAQSVKTDDKEVALTIDTAFGNDKTQAMLDILAKNNIKATFFVVGIWGSENPEMLNAIVAAGHEVQNHSMTHKRYPDIQPAEVLADAKQAQEYLKGATGSNANIIRLPYGAFDDKTIKILSENGFIPLKWSVDGEDWKTDDSKVVYNNVIKSISGGDIIMLQNNTIGAEGALQDIITKLIEKGYEFKTISELLPQGELSIDEKGRASLFEE